LLTAEEAGLAEFFANRIEQNLAHETWTIRAIIDRGLQTIVGHAGFHLSPDSESLVELGYSVGEPFRQQGIAKEAVLCLIAAAKATREVKVIRGCTAPTNEISKHLLRSLGFVFAGMVEDEEDGPEEVYLMEITERI
jgi:RimJ/RimL family protein N-acetyltransferase